MMNSSFRVIKYLMKAVYTPMDLCKLQFNLPLMVKTFIILRERIN